METKIDISQQDADIFIYNQMSPEDTNNILKSRFALLKKANPQLIARLEQTGQYLWLIRESRVIGLLTVHSMYFDLNLKEWVLYSPQRCMLSNNQGWIFNNNSPGKGFEEAAENAGGFVSLTQDNAALYLPDLLHRLTTPGFHPENRVNPKKGEQTQTEIYSRYIREPGVKPDPIAVPHKLFITLSCPLTIEETGINELMHDPVTVVTTGISYERTYLLKKYGEKFQEGVDFYPNIQLKNIIHYISARSLKNVEYLSKLEKINEDIQDPMHLEEGAMEEPVLSVSGRSYEKKAIESWIKTKENSSLFDPIPDPVTRENMRGKPLVPNVNLKNFINAWPEFYKDQRAQLTPEPMESSSPTRSMT